MNRKSGGAACRVSSVSSVRPASGPRTARSRTRGVLAAMCLCSAASIAGGLVGGCSDFQTDFQEMIAKAKPQRTDLIVSGRVKGQAVSGPGVDVSLPNVFRENDDVVIKGTITRRPGNDAVVPGFLYLEILAADGSLIDEELLHWSPEEIPTAGTRSALYSARILANPSAGSTVRVAYVAKAGDLRSLGGTEGGGGNGTGGRAAGHGSASHRVASHGVGSQGFGSHGGHK